MQTIVLTGATGGLGASVTERLSRDFQCVCLVRSEASGRHLQDRVPSARLIADVAAIRAFSPIFAFVHMAGGFATGSAPETFASMFDTNVMSAVNAWAAVSPHLMEGGRIVAISSAASVSAPSGLAAYSSSKAALNALIQTLAHELAPRKITANALLPTALATPPMIESGAKDLVPLERVAEWIAFLLSDRGRGVTGQLIGLTASS